MKNLVFALLLPFFSVSLLAECFDPIYVSHEYVPLWVNGIRPPETAVSYFDVVYGKARNYKDAYEAAEKSLLQKHSLVTGRYVRIQGDSTNYQDAFEIRAKYEAEYRRQCRADEYSVYLLVQIAKHPNAELPPLPKKYLKKMSSKKGKK
jgi:hypothetical protein